MTTTTASRYTAEYQSIAPVLPGQDLAVVAAIKSRGTGKIFGAWFSIVA